MARSRLVEQTPQGMAPFDDLITDSGAVLWSFIRGEQLEFPVILNFLSDVNLGYTFEAVVVEANNVPGQTAKPITIKTGGAQDTLTVRKPIYLSVWDENTAYDTEDVVLYNGIYYKLLSGAGRIEATTPLVDPLWEVTSLNKVYLQFPGTLASDWDQDPVVGIPVYGFFELRVTEPANSILQKTWKPVRGMVEILFSPTEIVADV